jgi:hypothetical protein
MANNVPKKSAEFVGNFNIGKTNFLRLQQELKVVLQLWEEKATKNSVFIGNNSVRRVEKAKAILSYGPLWIMFLFIVCPPGQSTWPFTCLEGSMIAIEELTVRL